MDKKDKVNVGIYRELYSQIREFCDFNDLKVSEYVNSLLKDAFMRDKYGDRPFAVNTSPENDETDQETLSNLSKNEKSDKNLKHSEEIPVLEDESRQESRQNVQIVEEETESRQAEAQKETNFDNFTDKEPSKSTNLPNNITTVKRKIKVK